MAVGTRTSSSSSSSRTSSYYRRSIYSRTNTNTYREYSDKENKSSEDAFTISMLLFVFIVLALYISSSLIDDNFDVSKGTTIWQEYSKTFASSINFNCSANDLHIVFSETDPKYCNYNTLEIVDKVAPTTVGYKYHYHTHYLSKMDSIHLIDRNDLKVYIFNEYNYKKYIDIESKHYFQIQQTDSNNYIIPSDNLYYFVFERTNYENTDIKLKYTIRRNIYCSNNHIKSYICKKNIGYINDITIPKSAKGMLITVDSNTEKTEWKEYITPFKITYNINYDNVSIITLLCIGLTVYVVMYEIKT